jgi:quinolinate synthase
MVRYARESEARELIVGTELGLVSRLRRENPDKRFYIVSEAAVCPNMKRIELQNVLWSLEKMRFEVTVPPDIRKKALKAVNRMVSITGR